MSHIRTKCETLRRSFISTGIKVWNNLPLDIRESPSLESFKLKLHKPLKFANVIYYYGQRWPAVLHARLRIGCSKLNYDRAYNLHIPNIDPACSCGAKLENASHFLLSCKNYSEQRVAFHINIEVITSFIINTLNGVSTLSVEENNSVFAAVHRFIFETRHFE